MRASTLLCLVSSVLCLLNCKPAPEPVDYHLEHTRANAPALPELCPSQRARHWTPGTHRTLLIFTSQGCKACERLLHMLDEHKEQLQQQNVAVLQAVIWEDSCFGAAKVAQSFPFAWSHAPLEQEEAWAVRSTPTIWVLGPDATYTISYLEGAVNYETLQQVIEAQ